MMIFLKMSIFPLFLLMGVAISRHISYYTDTSALQPIVTKSQEHRICAELCMSGLGGTPCGEDCLDISPQGLPLQSLKSNSSASFGGVTRQNSCSILCENNLGYPLCHCEKTSNKTKTNFVEICSHFCTNYNYMIYGCQSCSVYKEVTAVSMFLPAPNSSPSDSDDAPVVDWSLWCQKMCQDGDGGAACNCDLLPMSMDL